MLRCTISLLVGLVIGQNLYAVEVILANMFFPTHPVAWQWPVVWATLVFDAGLAFGYVFMLGVSDGLKGNNK